LVGILKCGLAGSDCSYSLISKTHKSFSTYRL